MNISHIIKHIRVFKGIFLEQMKHLKWKRMYNKYVKESAAVAATKYATPGASMKIDFLEASSESRNPHS